MGFEGLGDALTGFGGRSWDNVKHYLALASEWIKATGNRVMPGLFAFLLTRVGRALASLLVVAMAWLSFAQHYENKGAAKLSHKIEKRTAKNAAKAQGIRRDVARAPSSSLLDEWVRD